MKMGMGKGGKEGEGEEKEGRVMMLEVEEKLNNGGGFEGVFPRDGGGKEHKRGRRVKERNRNGGDTKERIIPRHHAGGKSKVG